MTLWVVLALMGAAAAFAALWPLSRRPLYEGGSDALVYRDQLASLAHDRDLRLIGPAEAEAARIEIARRLLAASDTTSSAAAPGHDLRRRAVAMLALVGVPIAAFVVYLGLGSPQLPAQPLAARAAAPVQGLPLTELIARVEAHLEREPQDGRGWEVIAPVYLRVGRFDDAVRARRDAMRLLGETATRQADVGEALTAIANGVVTAEAKTSFDRALQLDPTTWKARYFDGLAAEQDGQTERAATVWRDMLAQAPAGSPWHELVMGALERISATLPQPDAASVAAAATMDGAGRDTFIRGMVERLAERLKTEAQDADGWLRLVRAYAVLGERDKAKAAATQARTHFDGDRSVLQRIDDLTRSLGLET